MNDKSLIIQEACEALLKGSTGIALSIINQQYNFEFKEIEKRQYTNDQKMKVFLRDGFIDRYSGGKLVIPGILKVLSLYFPKEFPYQSHWKMSETHLAFWELIPTIDHIVPIAVGGKDEEDNWVTTSMLHNSIKSNWTMEQLNWRLFECGNINNWDGLTQVFLKLVDADKQLKQDSYVNTWYKLALKLNPM